MIITKADIGRKAVARNGEGWVVKSWNDKHLDCPVDIEDELGFVFHFQTNGVLARFVVESPHPYDLIRWADETEGAQ
jgi:hypothetical protein